MEGEGGKEYERYKRSIFFSNNDVRLYRNPYFYSKAICLSAAWVVTTLLKRM